MIAPVQSLMNMEMALYGGVGTNANAPSYLNGYKGGNNYCNYINPYSYGYGNSYTNYGAGNAYNQTFGQSIPYGYGVTNPQQTQQAAQESVFQGLSQVERKALEKDYSKSLAHTETIKDALLSGGLGFALMSNPRLIAHPINSFQATFTGANATNKAFAEATQEGKALYNLWNGTGKNAAEVIKNQEILREAWLQHNKAVARCDKWKLGWIRKGYKGADSKAVMEIVTKLEGALKAGNMAKINEYTAQLKHIYGSNPGALAKGVNWIKELFGAKTGATTVEAALKDIKGNTDAFKAVKSGIQSSAEMLPDFKKLATHGGWFGPAIWVGMEYMMDFGKIKTAFGQDNETGMKQLGQTTVKGIGAAAGWTLGEAAGKWAFAKLGAKIGSKIHPLLGTIIGGAIGFVGGSLGMCIAGKGTKALVGQDVADDIEAKKLAQSQEGQVQLLQNTMQRIQAGEKVSPEAQMAVQKLMTQMA